MSPTLLEGLLFLLLAALLAAYIGVLVFAWLPQRRGPPAEDRPAALPTPGPDRAVATRGTQTQPPKEMKIMSTETERPIALPEPAPAQPRPPYRAGHRRRALLFASPLLLGAIVVVLGAMIVVFMAWRSVNPGYVGVVFDKVNHRVTTGVLEPGWAIINPFTQSIQEYPVTIQTYAMVQKGS